MDSGQQQKGVSGITVGLIIGFIAAMLSLVFSSVVFDVPTSSVGDQSVCEQFGIGCGGDPFFESELYRR